MTLKFLEIKDFLKMIAEKPKDPSEKDFCVLTTNHKMLSFDAVTLNFQTVFLCAAGSCITTVGHHRFLTSSHSLSVIPAHTTFSISDISKDFKAFLLLFKPDFLKKGFVKSEIMYELLYISPEYAPIFDLNTTDFSDTLYKITKIKEENDQQSPFCTEVSRLYILQILYDYNRVCELCLINSDKLINRQYQVLYQFRKLTDEHFSTLKTVKEYAGLMNLSAKYMSECVKNHTGTAALSLIQNRIILEAEQLLNYSTLSIKSISYQLGFSSAASFSRFFKGLKGVSPVEFRTKP